MIRVGHLSDLHLDGSAERRHRLRAGVGHALARGCSHLVITGDLTATGDPAQLDELVDTIAAAWPSSRGLTVVPGNHDAGLPGFRRASICRLNLASGRPGAVVVGLDARFGRRAPAFRAAGQVTGPQLDAARAAAGLGLPTLIAIHHGPQLHPLHPFEGLSGRAELLALLRRYPNASVACGHDHRVLDVAVAGDRSGRQRIHAAACCSTHRDPLRVYEARAGEGFFAPVYKSADRGRYLPWAS